MHMKPEIYQGISKPITRSQLLKSLSLQSKQQDSLIEYIDIVTYSHRSHISLPEISNRVFVSRLQLSSSLSGSCYTLPFV